MKRRNHYRGIAAQNYEKSRHGPLWEKEYETVRAIADTWEPGETVLDVPVGTGRFLPIYEAAGVEVHGVDVSPDMLAEAKKKDTSATLQVGDVFDLPFADDTFDHAVCIRLLNWMDLAEVGQALREMARVTTGTLYVSVTVLIGPPRSSVARIIHKPEAWADTVEAAGLEVLDTNVLWEHRSHCYQVVTVR